MNQHVRVWGHARDGLIGGIGLGVFHAVVLYGAGLYHLVSGAGILLSLARFAGLLGVLGAAFGFLYGLTLGRIPWTPLQAIRPALLAPVLAYLLVWGAILVKEFARRREFLEPGFWKIAGIVAVLGVLVLAFVIHRFRRRREVPGPGGGALRFGALLAVCAALFVISGFRVSGGASGPEPSVETVEEEPPPGPPRNLLLLTIDTLRADHLGLYGYERNTSPAIDSLAAGGVRFDNAVCQRPKTSPSFASIMTGLYPRSHGVHRPMQVLVRENLTLAEILTGAGWTAGATITNANLYPEFGFHQGFRDYGFGYGNAEEVSDDALVWLEENARTTSPWFLWVHYTDPHTPYVPVEGYDDLFESDTLFHYHPHRNLVNAYDGEIRYTDDHLRRVLAKLAELGLAESTLIVFTADHGESLGEHHYYYEHGLYTYEPSARIPLVFRGDGFLPSGEVSGAMAGTVDFLPTILDLLGVDVPGDVEGMSLAACVRDPSAPGPQEFVFHDAGYSPHTEGGLTQAIRRPGSKYIHRLRDWARFPGTPLDVLWSMDALLEGGLDPDEYYDLTRDPHEVENLILEDPERAKAELRVLQRMADRVGSSPGDFKGRSASPEDLDPETYERLRTLGYIQ